MRKKGFKPKFKVGGKWRSCIDCKRDYDRKTGTRCAGSCRGYKLACEDFIPKKAPK